MKKREIILAAVIILAALLLWGIFRLTGRSGGDLLRITDTNVCEIRNGTVRMIAADCPDHLCMESAPIDSGGGTIICLPNRVFLEVVSSGSTNSLTPDTVTS